MTKKSSFFRLDERVFFSMAALCLLSLLIMAFRFAASTPCMPVKIAVKSTTLVSGNIIRFDAVTQQGRSFSWNFGDGTSKDEEISITNHEYKSSGKYTVSVMVNGECSDFQDIYITEAKVIVNTNLQPMISSEPGDTAYINVPVKFADNSAATKWEWRFGQTNSIDAVTRNPVYTYTVPGRKTVTLKINDRGDLVQSYSIMVIDKQAEKAALKQKADVPRPLPPPSIIIAATPHTDPLKIPTVDPVKKEEVKEKPKAPALTNDQLKAMLLQVADGQKKAEDFSEYLGGQLGIQVTLNNEVMSFTKLCDQLKDMKKKIKDLKVIPVTDKETNHILTMNVVVERQKRILGIKI